MVTFLSLFLGLVTGSQTVEVTMAPEVALVEILLDGRSEPWATTRMELRRVETN
jgi:hypothetical protein